MTVDNILLEKIEIKKQKRAEFTKYCIDPIYSIGSKHDLRFNLEAVEGEFYNKLHWRFINWIAEHNENFFYNFKKKKKMPNDNLRVLEKIKFYNDNTEFSCNDSGFGSSLECYPERWNQLKEILIIIKKSFPEYLKLKTEEYNLQLQKDLKKYDDDEIICNYCLNENPNKAIFCCFCGIKLETK